jgi:hypothetical protein
MASFEKESSAESYFGYEIVRKLTNDNFDLSNKSCSIMLKDDGCCLVLFYGTNDESKSLAYIWAKAASQVAGPTFAACNLFTEKKVAEAFLSLTRGDSPVRWASLKQIPFILVYRSGWPRAFYNGERVVQAIIDYSLTLACEIGYNETEQLFSSTHGDESKNYEISLPKLTEPRNKSTEYTSESMRGTPRTPFPILNGSKAEQELLDQVGEESESLPAVDRGGERDEIDDNPRNV